MKTKLAALFFCGFMLSALFACGQAPAPAPSDNGASASQESSPQSVIDLTPWKPSSNCASSSSRSEGKDPADDEPYIDRTIREILDGIKTGDYKNVALYMGASDPEVYGFIQDMTVDSYEILERTEELYSTLCKVKFTISKSNNEYFPLGESVWDLGIGDGIDLAYRFALSKDEQNTTPSPSGSSYSFCYSFSYDLGVFETASDFNAFIWDKTPNMYVFIDDVIHFYVETSPADYNDLFYIEDLETYLWDTTRITGVDFTIYSSYNKEDGTIRHDGHGGYGYYWRAVSTDYNKNANLYTSTIHYYADTASFVIAKTMQYQYTVFADGTYRMLSTELLYDSGYPIRVSF